jgi:hypothetical protein
LDLVEYLFVLRGRLSTVLEDTLAPVSVREGDDSTEMRIEIPDDAAFYGVIATLERLGLSIESLEPSRPADTHQTDHRSSSDFVDR